MMKHKRDLYWDSLKFYLIFLVVLGHFLELHLLQHSDGRVLYNMIYLFHMPLFVFISGRFSVVRDRSKYLKGIWRLAKLFLLFHGFQFLIFWLTGLESNILHIFSTTFAMWYLLSLVWWRIMLYYIPEKWMMEHRGHLLSASVFIALVVGLVPLSKQLAFQATWSYLPFFLLGYFSKDVDMKAMLHRIPYWVAMTVIVGSFVVVYLWFNKPLHDLYFSTTYWASGVWHLKERILTRPVLMVVATILGCCVMRVSPTVKWLAKFGQATLYIYLGHIFVRLLVIKLINEGYIPDRLYSIILYAIIVTFALTWLSLWRNHRQSH